MQNGGGGNVPEIHSLKDSQVQKLAYYPSSPSTYQSPMALTAEVWAI